MTHDLPISSPYSGAALDQVREAATKVRGPLHWGLHNPLLALCIHLFGSAREGSTHGPSLLTGMSLVP